MGNPVYVINPNSNTAVTAAIDPARARLLSEDGQEITCLTVAKGPRAVGTSVGQTTKRRLRGHSGGSEPNF